MHPYFVEFPSFEDIYNIDYSADVNLTALNFSLDMQLLDDIRHKLNSYNLPFDLFVLDVNGESPIQCSQLETTKPSTYKLDVQTITIRAAEVKPEFTSQVEIPEDSDNREQSGQYHLIRSSGTVLLKAPVLALLALLSVLFAFV